METKSKIPALRFKGFTDAWEQRKLIDYLEVSKEKNKNEVFGKEDVLSVSGDYGIVNQIEFQGRSFAGASVAPYGIVDTGDIVYTKSPLKSNPYGIIKANKGKTGIVSTLYAVYKPLDNVCSDFVQIYFEQDARMNNYMRPLVNKGAKNDMKVSDVNALKGEVCFPSKYEQIKISEHFAKLDRLIALHQRKCDQTKELKKTMLQKMFPKKGERIPEIRFPEFTDEWEEKKLGEVGETFTGLSGKTKADFGHGAGKFVTYVNVFNNPISDLKGVDSIEIDDNQKQVQYGDILITTSSETPEEVGMTSVWLGREENVYLNSFCFGFRPTTELSSYYMAYALRSHEVRKKFIILAQGISRYNISKTKVMEINIPFPSLPEQEAIGTYFQTLDQDIAQIEKKLADLKELKKTLLRQLFV